mmetsp:Transcript_64632/g.172415  ORF Transcript_64632/g.172415 Transcript_64632/m.172415 type:complete len:523 (-) Transcript_64632:145-1713(-)
MAGTKVFVGSLPPDITEETLRAEFSKYGDVDEIFVKPGCEMGRQWAMVKFLSFEQAQMAKESCDRILMFPGSEKPCDVMLAKNQGQGKGGAPPPGAYYPPAGGNGAAYGQPAYGQPTTATGSQPRKIFVGSLPDGITDETLRSEFGRYGNVEDIFIKQGCESGRQWAFVSFTYPEQAASAAQATNGVLQFVGSHKTCEVTLARHQGMFGQDPMMGVAGAPAIAYSPAAPVASISQAPRKIFVGSLPDNISDATLRSEFSKFGGITDVYVKTGCEPNRQWAFVSFESPEQAQYAKENCDRILVFPGSDRPCEVTIARHQGQFGRETDDPSLLAIRPAAQGYGGAAYAPPAAVEGPKKCFVGSLSDRIDEATLKAEFSKYGQVVEVFLKSGQEPGRSWAFVTFVSHEQAQYAKDCTDRVLMFPGQERTCEVTLARNQGKFGQAPLNPGASHGGAPAAAYPAAGGPQPPPPSTPPPAHLTPWRMYKTASGLPYYHNTTTGITQWDCPPDFQVPGQALGQQRYSPY